MADQDEQIRLWRAQLAAEQDLESDGEEDLSPPSHAAHPVPPRRPAASLGGGSSGYGGVASGPPAGHNEVIMQHKLQAS